MTIVYKYNDKGRVYIRTTKCALCGEPLSPQQSLAVHIELDCTEVPYDRN